VHQAKDKIVFDHFHVTRTVHVAQYTSCLLVAAQFLGLSILLVFLISAFC